MNFQGQVSQKNLIYEKTCVIAETVLGWDFNGLGIQKINTHDRPFFT